MRALISVYNKEGILEFAKVLDDLGYELVSTGGTAELLAKSGLKVIKVEELTGFPEILNGRVKTLHPVIHAGILYRDWLEGDALQIQELNIKPIDVVVVNLYPFEDKLNQDLTEQELMEFIDIGGPTLLRASAKNFYRVLVVCDPKDYSWVADKLKSGNLSFQDRKYLAYKAFSLTAYYDALISRAISSLFEISQLPEHFALPFRLANALRYGENPHQKGWLLLNPLENLGITRSKVLQGKEMSFNNYLDADTCAKLVSEFQKPACVIVKHGNPCGAALGEDLTSVFEKAISTDPESSFGGVVAFNDKVDKTLASKLADVFLEVVVAPEYSHDAFHVLSKKKNLRLIQFVGYSYTFDIKKVSGGYLLQEEDTIDYQKLEVVSQRHPTHEEMEDMLFAWKVCKYIKSNAVVIAKEGRTLGIGSGNVSRVDSLRCAISRALRQGFDLKGSVLASEAFFPFRDSIDLANTVGINAVIQPGGSIRDKEVIQAVNEHGMCMVFTHTRHFRH